MAIDDDDGGDAGTDEPAEGSAREGSDVEADAGDRSTVDGTDAGGSTGDGSGRDAAGDASAEREPAVVGEYDWEDFKREYYYDDDGDPPADETFDAGEYLGFEPDDLSAVVGRAGLGATQLTEAANSRTVRVDADVDEDAFFSNADGSTTVVTRYDLEKAVPQEKKHHFREVDRYWVNKPFAFVVIFHSEKENEKKYYLIEPYLTPVESDLKEFLSGKLKTAIKYSSEDVIVQGDESARSDVIERETHDLLERYGLYADGARPTADGIADVLRDAVDVGGLLGSDEDDDSPEATDREPRDRDDEDAFGDLHGIEVRPEPALLEEDAEELTEYQIEKLLYLLRRDFIGFERIDGIKHDINIEDISCDGYNSPVFVYHSDYEQIISNVYHGEEELDEFVVKMAQRSGKGISKRSPQVDATLPDGSRSQLTLGKEVSDHGTNYTIRQFKDVPFTPIDLINWNTFSLNEMAFLWLCIENHKSLIFAGGTASGKTTSLNAVSLFIPSKAKIVSIEDTREVELPQRNWIASVTRPSFSEGDKGDVDEFDLLEAALRQRPEYIVMGEIRGEEGRTLFQVMSTGHTTLTTFHADSVGEVIKRFTTDPINVSKTMFTALDLVSIQTQTRVQGNKVRRNKSLTEINHYDPENDEINVQDVYQWQAETDEYLKMGESNTLEEITFDRGWNRDRLEEEIFTRELVLAYLINRGLNTYTQVAATLQAFINDPDTILTLIANEDLERSLEDLREMESVKIDIDPEKEAMVPRPSAGEEMLEVTGELLEDGESLLSEYRGLDIEYEVADVLEVEEAEDVDVAGAAGGHGESGGPFDYGGFAFDSGEEGATPDGGEPATGDAAEEGPGVESADELSGDAGGEPFGEGTDQQSGDAGGGPFGDVEEESIGEAEEELFGESDGEASEESDEGPFGGGDVGPGGDGDGV